MTYFWNFSVLIPNNFFIKYSEDGNAATTAPTAGECTAKDASI